MADQGKRHHQEPEPCMGQWWQDSPRSSVGLKTLQTGWGRRSNPLTGKRWRPSASPMLPSIKFTCPLKNNKQKQTSRPINSWKIQKNQQKTCWNWQPIRVRLLDTNIQDLTAFLYTSNEQEESEMKNTIPCTLAPSKIKYLGINLTKCVQMLYEEKKSSDERSQRTKEMTIYSTFVDTKI